MAKTPRLYTRLTRSCPGLGSYTSLWLAADHVMLVTANGYQEKYQRFLLRDIKGFLITPSRSARYAVSITGGITLLLGLIGAGQWGKSSAAVWLTFAMIGLIVTLGLLLSARTCRVRVITGVQTAEWFPLNRLRKTRRVLATLRPLIEAAQSDLVPGGAPVREPGSAVPSLPPLP